MCMGWMQVPSAPDDNLVADQSLKHCAALKLFQQYKDVRDGIFLFHRKRIDLSIIDAKTLATIFLSNKQAA